MEGGGSSVVGYPSLEMLLQALFEWDPSSAPGPDVFCGIIYCMHKSHFALVLLELIQCAARDRTLPHVTRRLHQMQTKRHMLVLKTATGKLVFSADKMVQELVNFWSTIMRPMEASIQERRLFLTDFPRQWWGAGQVLWRYASLEMVQQALSELDPYIPLGSAEVQRMIK